ncbi:acyltransferase family protein [Gluconacetobacter sacchari]|uniref:acyltransferase family protein n=1 Tax=Gluconacetobacter sacchari TaxID=92759 RepID=UPI0039B6D324
MRNNTPQRHLMGIDLVRFFAATIVMIYHVNFFYRLRGLPLNRFGWPISDHLFISDKFGWVGVEIFFVISGLVIHHSASRGTASSFAVNRMLRLVPGVWICATISLLIYAFLGEHPLLTLMKLYVCTLLFWPFSAIDGVYWTLGVEISFYAIVFYLLLIDRLRHLEWIMFAFGMVSLSFWCVALTLETVLPHIHGRYAGFALLWTHKAVAARIFQLCLIQHGCFFALGVLIKEATESGLTRIRLITGMLLCCGCSLEIIGQNDLIARLTKMDLNPLFPLAIWWIAFAAIVLSVTQVLAARSWRPEFTRVLKFMGRITYPLYLVPAPVTILICTLLAPSLGTNAVPVAILGAFIVAVLVDAYPEPAMRGLLKRIHRPVIAALPRESTP